MYTGKIRDVFMHDLTFHYPHELNIHKITGAAELFIGKHDFSAYCKAESLEIVRAKKMGAVREIYDFTVRKTGGYTELAVTGNGFLHNMVRIMAGTLIYVSEGKRSLDDIRESLTGGNREIAGKTLPACGLYLDTVEY
jgi:tRNA pseudouridine38-40 synthase